MKSANYVYQVAKAYRLAIDRPEREQEAEAILKLDFGRSKIAYFLGKDVKKGKEVIPKSKQRWHDHCYS